MQKKKILCLAALIPTTLIFLSTCKNRGVESEAKADNVNSAACANQQNAQKVAEGAIKALFAASPSAEIKRYTVKGSKFTQKTENSWSFNISVNWNAIAYHSYDVTVDHGCLVQTVNFQYSGLE